MAKKIRIPIPEEIASEILFISDRTCCKCNATGKSVQIHHIDDDPSNNDIENLCTLCFDCHNETMIKGGFGRKLHASEINKYRSEWIERVKARKQDADKIASIKNVTGDDISDIEDELYYKTSADSFLLKRYLDKILVVQKAQLLIAQDEWDVGYGHDILRTTYKMADFYQEILLELSTFYPKGHFDKKHPKIFFNDIVASISSFHYFIAEPEGEGSGGTMERQFINYRIMKEAKEMVVKMVRQLVNSYFVVEDGYIIKWEEAWSIDAVI